MRTLGRFTTAAGLAGGIVAVVVLVRSMPDIKRYLKIRAM
jgi:hypothetical protein